MQLADRKSKLNQIRSSHNDLVLNTKFIIVVIFSL